MKVYLVRHGETSGNLASRHQSEKTPLTERGEVQATDAGRYLLTKEPTHLVSSTMIRALETASIIGNTLNLIPETSALFAEVGRPPRMNGYHLKSAYSLWFYARWYFGLTDYSKEGGETYKMVRDRLRAGRELLAAYPEDARVVVVSHSVYIIFFLAHMCQERAMHPFQALWHFVKILRIKNGSVTALDFNASAAKGVCAWQVEKLP